MKVKRNTTRRKKMENKYKALWMLIKMMGKNDPLYLLTLILQAIFPALNTLISVYVPTIFINQLVSPKKASDFIGQIIILVIIKIAIDCLERLFNRLEFIRRSAINEYISFEISKKAMDLTYANIEDTRILDLKEKAASAIEFGQIHQLLFDLKDIIECISVMIGTALIIINFSPYLVGFSIVISILIILVDKTIASKNQKVDQEMISINRRFSYYFSLMAGRSYQKEIRAYDLGHMIKDKTNNFVDEIAIKFNDMFMYEANYGSLKIILDSLLRLVSYSYVAMRTLSAAYGPQISFGDFSAIIRANESFMTSFQKMFSETIGFTITLRNLEPLYDFMVLEVEEEENEEKAGDFESLEFRNVSFAYPGTDRLILDNISFKISKGEKISIVGVNNAGKTTIVKLILRFFEVSHGEILYNGRNIEEYQKESLYKKISAVLQDFSIMPFTIRENIISSNPYDRNKLGKILDELDLSDKVNSLEVGIDTYLNKEIFDDATDLSLGQKQKLAIGRCLYQNPDMIILDEPTASLDPLAEAKIYENFNQMTAGKTAIFISHRMSSSRFTDKILLLDEGKVKAFDSHKNLMAYDNIYSRLYKSQAKYYQN